MRKHISLKTKLAAVLLQLREYGSDGQWLPIIDHFDAKHMSADQIISLFHFDHYPVPHAEGGPDEPWNLQAELIQSHHEKTRKRDVPQIAKNKRIKRKHDRHVERIGNSGLILTETMTLAEAKERWPDTKLPYPHTKPMPREIYAGIRSRGFDKTKTRTFGGKVKPRKKR